MKKVLVGYILDGKHSGIDKYLLSVAAVAKENGVKLDFLTDEKTKDLNNYLSSLGFGLIEIPSLKKPIRQYRKIKKIIKNGGYDGVYFNISEAFNCMGLLAAKSQKVPVRIVHSHSSGVDRKNKYVRLLRTFLNNVFKGVISKIATKRYACADVAGEWLFNKDYEIIYNAVDGKKFSFNEETRRKKREELGINTEKLFIHVGNFCYAKNHYFLIDVMEKIVKKDKSAILLAVGVGYDFENVKAYAKEKNLLDNIRFMGVREDVAELLCAADCFIFPSRIEGLSITCVEAQFSGLECVLSSAISRQTEISNKVIFLPTKDPSLWAETALKKAENRTAASLKDGMEERFDLAHQKVQLLEVLRS